MALFKKFKPYLRILFFAILVIATSPSFLRTQKVILIKKTLVIQTSKMDPPRIAFDQLRDNRLPATDAPQKRDGFYNLNQPQVVNEKAIIAIREKKMILQPMVIARQDFSREMPEEIVLENKKEVAAEQNIQSEPQYSQVVRKISDDEVLENARAHLRQAYTNGGEIVRGDLTADGLPFGDPRWQIRVSRYEDGVKKEDAVVDPQKGTYQINVASNSGTIKAELFDAITGEVLGSGSRRLGTPPSTPTTVSKNTRVSKSSVNDADSGIVLRRAINTIASTVQDFYANPTSLMSANPIVGVKTRVKNPQTRVLLASNGDEARSDVRGQYEFDHVRENSWGIVRVEAKGYYSGLHLQSATNKPQVTPLFPLKMITALKEIIRDQNVSSTVAENGSIVWGQVVHDGKPLAGAGIEAEFFDKYKVVYFNSLLMPDIGLTTTSDNGYFAILNLPAGMHSLVASRLSGYLSHVNVIVDENTVSVANLESSVRTEKVDVKVYDGIGGMPQNAELEMQSLELPLQVQGFSKLDIAPIHRLSLMNVHAELEKYVDATYVYEDDQDSIQVPLVQSAWLKGIMGTKKLSELPGTGIIVGFVSFDAFTVKLSQENYFSQLNIIYFNVQGDVVPKAVNGGGFVIYNVPPSVQTVSLLSGKSNSPIMKVVPVDAGRVTVLGANSLELIH